MLTTFGASACVKATLTKDSPQVKKLHNQKTHSVRRLKHVLRKLSMEFDDINKYERKDLLKEISVISKHLDNLECSMEAQKLMFMNEKTDETVAREEDLLWRLAVYGSSV